MAVEKFKFIKTPIEGLIIIETIVFQDERGFFMETYNLKEFRANGIVETFVQDNHSHSKKGVLRGLHFQQKHPQGKLVRVIKGKVFDVAVDLRKNSPTFRKWFGIEFSDNNHKQFYIPPCFAHGFLSLKDDTDFSINVQIFIIQMMNLELYGMTQQLILVGPLIILKT